MTIKISPSILTANFSILKEEILNINTAEYVHLDVMDMHYVPNLTFGSKLIKDIRKYTKQEFDVHLMVEQPELYIENMANAGADIITVHYETAKHLDKLINEIKKYGKKAGVALNPTTSEEVLKYIIKDIDLILVMTVNPGFGGQSFLYSQVDKIKNIKKMIDNLGLNIDLEVDGGIDNKTAKIVVDAGANVLVSGSYIFSQKDYNKAIEELKNSLV